MKSAPLDRLCLHTLTTWPWPIETAVARYAGAGIKGITIGRDAIEGRKPESIATLLHDHGLAAVSLCSGGFFPALNNESLQRAIDDSRRAIAEAHAIGAPHVVLVCGAIPGLPLAEARRFITDAIATLLPDCAASGVKLAVEPLHPMYADCRSAINTLAQANDLVEKLDSPWVGVAVDAYHVWWDPALEKEIARCGSLQKLFAFHVSDWKTSTEDILLDRGLMGEGCIPLREIRERIEAAGFRGWNEVEVLSREYWSADQDQFLVKIVEAYCTYL